MEDQRVDAHIRQHAVACKAAFDVCVANPALRGNAWIRAAQGDFNLWCSTSQATGRGKASMDRRLSKHPDRAESVCDLLVGLTTAVERYEEIISSPSPPARDIDQDDSAAESSPSLRSSQSSDDALSDGSWGSDLLCHSMISESILSQYASYIRTILDDLARISVAVRRIGEQKGGGKGYSELDEASHKDFRTHLTRVILASFQDKEASDLGTNEKMLRVSDATRLTNVQMDLVKVNILRRNLIQEYSQNSAPKAKLEKEYRPEDQPPRVPDRPPDQAVDSNAKHRAAAPPTPSQTQDKSQLNAPPTASAHVKTVTAIDPQPESKDMWDGKGSPRTTKTTSIVAPGIYPRCPKPEANEPLICPYCNEKLPSSYAEDELSWKAHIAQDIVPYSCIIDGCDTPHDMYLTADRLLGHMVEKHSSPIWTCVYCLYAMRSSEPPVDQAPYDFRSADECESHMEEAHCDIVPVAQRSFAVELSKRQMIGPLSCPLCEFAVANMTSSVDDHILKHMREFSLRALPSDAGELFEKGSTTLQVPGSAGALSYTQEDWMSEIVLAYPNLNQADRINVARELLPFIDEQFNKYLPLYEQLDQTILSSRNCTPPLAELWGSLFWILSGARETCREYNEDKEYPLDEGKVQKTSFTEEMIEEMLLRNFDRLLGATADSLPDLDAQIRDVTPFHGNLGPTNRTLIGREDILEQLESLLSEGANRLIASNHLSASETTAERFKMAIRYINSLSKQQNIILEGDNGIGKTEVALSLSNEMRRTQDWTILWIHAQDEKSIRASYTQILRHLGRPVAGDDANDREILTLLYHLTWNFAGRWMMILDGLDAPGAAYLRLANMLPSGHRGTLIFTTAYPRLGRLFGPAKVIKVPPLDNDAALQLFIAARGKPLSPEELPLAAEVAGGVDSVPLAIIEAALQPL